MRSEVGTTFLPRLNRNASEALPKVSQFPKTALHRIHYPLLQDGKTKENHHSIMVQSCLSNNRFEDILDQQNELKVTKDLQPSEEGSSKMLEPITNYIGKEAPLKYYQKYKSLSRTIQKRDLKIHSESRDLNLESPVVSLLEKAQSLRVLPLCLGLVKPRGDVTILNVSDYNLGDRYIIALSAGLQKARSLQKMYLSGNRITDLSLAQLASAVSQQVTVLELSRNKITVFDQKLLQMIIEPQYRLEWLGIANNHLKVSSVDAIFRNARYSKHLRRLDLRHNKFGLGCLESMIELLQKTKTLQELYIGGNYLIGKNGERVFKAIANNKTLRVFDYSLNQLGDEGGMAVAQAIAICLQSNRTLEHLDLSFNNFNKEASQVIASGLESNRTLYGFHFRGNYGYINANGFLILTQREGTLLHSVDSFKVDSFEITAPRQQNSLNSHYYRDVCWICEGWYEQEFKLNLPKTQENMLVFIHFDFEKYQPRLISLSEHVKYTAMVPPRKYKYFYTVNKDIYIDSNCSKQNIALIETHTYQMNHQMRTFKVETVNYRKGKAKKIVNQWNQLIVKTLPRNNGLTLKKEKDPWVFQKSIWAKEYRLQNQEMLRKCFERDWKCSKLSSLVKVQTDQDKVKDLLWESYAQIKNLYKYYSSWNPFGDVWAVSSNPFTQFCQQARIINKDTPLKIIDLTFITTNSMTGPNWKGNSMVPERGLVRFQFMQSLVRLAQEKYKKLSITDNFADSIGNLLKDHIRPLAENYNPHQWRDNKYFNQFNDTLIKKYRPIFSVVYKKNSKLKVRPGQKPYMCLNQFKGIFERIGLSTTLTERDIFIAFNNAMMTQFEELQSERIMKMTQIEFIEGIARCSQSLPANCTLQAMDNPPLHFKFEWIVNQLRGICPQELKSQLPELQKSIFVEDEEDE